MEDSNFHLFAANIKRKWQTAICLLEMETENKSLFFLVGKCFSICADLWLLDPSFMIFSSLGSTPKVARKY
jgi:hypothetical protein